MLPGDDPCFVSTGLDTQDQTPNEDVPHFVGFGLGLGLDDKTLGQGNTHAGHRCRVDAQSVGWPGLRCLDEDRPHFLMPPGSGAQQRGQLLRFKAHLAITNPFIRQNLNAQ